MSNRVITVDGEVMDVKEVLPPQISNDPEAVLVIGLGKTGLPLAVSLADRFKVIGIDKDATIIRQIQDGVCPYMEPGLQPALTEAVDNKRLFAVQSLNALVNLPSVVIVHVGASVAEDGSIDHTDVVQALQQVGTIMRDSCNRHTIIITSTVIPGFCDRAARMYLEQASGKRLNDGFNVAYVPDNVQLGDALYGFICPDYTVIGASNSTAMDQAVSVYNRPETPIIQTSLVNAELFKLALSGYLAVKATFANELGNLCESLIGADVDVITNIMSQDRRVGPTFLTAGSSLGGFRLPAEVNTLLAVAGFAKTRLPIVESAFSSNANVAGRIFNLITTELLTAKNRRVTILGLAYRSGLPYKQNSMGYMLSQRLHDLGVTVRTYDPITADEFSVKSAQAAVNGAGVVLVVNQEEEFKGLKYGKDQLIIDVWRYLDGSAIEEQGARYLALGIGRKR